MDLSLDWRTSLKCSQITWESRIWCRGLRESEKCSWKAQSEWSTSSRGREKPIYSGCGKSNHLSHLSALKTSDVRTTPDVRWHKYVRTSDKHRSSSRWEFKSHEPAHSNRTSEEGRKSVKNVLWKKHRTSETCRSSGARTTGEAWKSVNTVLG